MIKEYLKDLYKQHSWQDNREESFYPLLKALLEQIAKEQGLKQFHITVLPKKTQGSCPDMRIWDGKQKHIGYVECKTPDANLDEIEKSEQLKRYRKTFPNVILTNFIEFRLYRNGNLINQAMITNQMVMYQLKTCPPVQQEDKLTDLLSIFFGWSYPAIKTASALAKELAERTRFLKDMLLELTPENADLQGFHSAFRKYLLPELDLNEFTDLYAQTITYGLFTARTRSDNDFNRLTANRAIPQTIGILRDVFNYLSLQELPPALESMIDDIAGVIAFADVKAIMTEYDSSGKGNDAIVHFYETFLSVYDPELRDKRGVYYTPEPVVSYIVRSIHTLLQDRFLLKDGLADEKVTLLDPAAGTLSFIYKAVKVALAHISENYGGGLVSSIFHKRILPHYIAFELMMAPYTIGHLRMSWLLHELNCELDPNERVRLYLTNTLDPDDIPIINVPGLGSLSVESNLAGEVKRNEPVLVIIGNPPYSVVSANTGKWITEQMKDYLQIDGVPLNERNAKVIGDDYVKFIRFAQYKIDQSGKGMVGFITNHGYLDNPTFRGMRHSLIQSFDEIYILNLHGNAQRKEKSPDGSKDQNVFDIMQGVAIAILIKHKKSLSKKRICFADLWGNRQTKYDWLDKFDLNNTDWQDINPTAPFYLFTPFDDSLVKEYEKGVSVQDIFINNNSGIKTSRDELTIQSTPEKMLNIINLFAKMDKEQARKTWDLGVDSHDWNIEAAQKDIIDSGMSPDKIKPYLYRPFDKQYSYYTGKAAGFISRPRNSIMQYLVNGNNMALITVRQVAENEFNHALVTNTITDCRIMLSNRGHGFIYPLYLPADSKAEHATQDIFETDTKDTDANVPNNIRPEILAMLNAKYVGTGLDPVRKNNHPKQNDKQSNAGGDKHLPYVTLDAGKSNPCGQKIAVTPEDVFAYIYAVLNTPIYRTRYLSFLKMDFPKVPFCDDYAAFQKGVALGQIMIDLHLMKEVGESKTSYRFEGVGDNLVHKVTYLDNAIWINDVQRFETVLPEVWKFKIGGYQVCDKWLKDRKEQHLKPEEILHYLKILDIVEQTLKIQLLLDEWYKKSIML